MKAFLGVQAAFDDVWEVDIDKRANTAVKRLRALIGLVAIGLAQVGHGLPVGHRRRRRDPRDQQVAPRGRRARHQHRRRGDDVPLPHVGAGHLDDWCGRARCSPVVLFTVLQLFGTVVVSRMIANASEIYGTFASMLALMSWFSLHASHQPLRCRAQRRARTPARATARPDRMVGLRPRSFRRRPVIATSAPPGRGGCRQRPANHRRATTRTSAPTTRS